MNIWQKLPKNYLILAPMEGVTDIVFRQVVASAAHPDLFFTEFTNAMSYASEKGRPNALNRLKIAKTDAPIIAQIWGKSPDAFARTAEDLEGLGFQGVDINMGCPDKNVVKTGGGSALIRTPDLAVEIIRATKAATNLPVSIKTRLGYSSIEEYKSWLPTLLAEHPAALTVHLRTKKEMSKVSAHFELIPDILNLRNELSPETHLIINGDILDKPAAEKLFAEHKGLNGIMIGRGVFANPYCFSSHRPTKEELFALLNHHLDLYEIFTPTRNFAELKRFFKIYINNFPGASDLRAQLMETTSLPEARTLLATPCAPQSPNTEQT